MINREILENFSKLKKTIASFFDLAQFLEVQTPHLCPEVIPEPSIDLFKSSYLHPYNKQNKNLYLLPSPELWMKRLLAENSGPIYQIGSCFRNGEQLGPYHNPEFTMLEWYTPFTDYQDSLQICEELIDLIRYEMKISDPYWKPPYIHLTMKEAFHQILDLDLEKLGQREALKGEAEKLGLMVGEDPSWEELFNQIFVNFIESNLPDDKPVFLLDYPDQLPCLAKKLPEKPYYQRWELYARGVELANCFTEEDDVNELKELFEAEQKRKQGAHVPGKFPQDFLKAISRGFPECSGVAMGLERLFMVLYNLKSIEEVILFPHAQFFGDKPSERGNK